MSDVNVLLCAVDSAMNTLAAFDRDRADVTARVSFALGSVLARVALETEQCRRALADVEAAFDGDEKPGKTAEYPEAARLRARLDALEALNERCILAGGALSAAWAQESRQSETHVSDALHRCGVYLKKLNLIETERDSTDVEFDIYQGRRVTVDDGCPVADNVYTTYLFGNGAVAYGNGSPVGHVATEVDRDKQTGGGVDYLINRKAFILHPRGIAYTGTKREHVETPTRAELAMAENWNPVYEPKQLRIVAIKHKIG